jgi:hypothetical protein
MHRERTHRIPMRIAVSVQPPQGRPIEGWARNLSISGIYVETARQLPVGTACVLRMSMPQGRETREVRCEATVARSDADGMGLCFTHPHPDVVRELARQVVWTATPGRGGLRAG